ncbi:MAG TPA: DEAD/DEAH box helicase [Crocinitomix sp.]|nr:DEAD/DEAH box helicase [Crocinitomix sp.]
MKFSEYSLSIELKQNLERLGFNRPTDIQFKTIGPILRGEDLLAIAQTGTGKTAAFAIPILDKLHKSKTSKRSDGIKCLVMVPTRELAIQITEAFNELGKNLRVKTASIYGGVDQDPQIIKLEKGVDILVTTPGRMFDFLHQKHLRLNRVTTLVLDEADHMLDLGFLKDIQDVNKFLPKDKQTLFFSATIDKKIKKYAYSLIKGNAIHIQISPKNPVNKNITHTITKIKMDDKRFFLERLIKDNPESKMLVFVRTKIRAERVKKAMARVNINADTIHGDKEQKDRLIALNKFKSGDTKVLIATDVSARGIDIPNVEFVVNYDIPEQAENYVHRIGRTGRGNNKGIAVSFYSPEEKSLIEDIEKYLGQRIENVQISKKEYGEIINFREEKINDWKSVINQIDELENLKKKKKKKKRKK